MKKKGIANQIQTRIGKSVGIIFVIVAIVVLFLLILRLQRLMIQN